MYQMGHDKYALEQLTGQPVRGFGVPFDYYDETTAAAARHLGFTYARGSVETGSYAPIFDPYWQNAGMFHLNPGLWDYVEGFFGTEEELACCIIVGHSYDLDAENLWAPMERMFARVAADPDTLSMTHLELVEYLQALRRTEWVGDTLVNHSAVPVWYESRGCICRADPQSGGPI